MAAGRGGQGRARVDPQVARRALEARVPGPAAHGLGRRRAGAARRDAGSLRMRASGGERRRDAALAAARVPPHGRRGGGADLLDGAALVPGVGARQGGVALGAAGLHVGGGGDPARGRRGALPRVGAGAAPALPPPRRRRADRLARRRLGARAAGLAAVRQAVDQRADDHRRHRLGHLRRAARGRRARGGGRARARGGAAGAGQPDRGGDGMGGSGAAPARARRQRSARASTPRSRRCCASARRRGRATRRSRPGGRRSRATSPTSRRPGRARRPRTGCSEHGTAMRAMLLALLLRCSCPRRPGARGLRAAVVPRATSSRRRAPSSPTRWSASRGTDTVLAAWSWQDGARLGASSAAHRVGRDSVFAPQRPLPGGRVGGPLLFGRSAPRSPCCGPPAPTATRARRCGSRSARGGRVRPRSASSRATPDRPPALAGNDRGDLALAWFEDRGVRQRPRVGRAAPRAAARSARRSGSRRGRIRNVAAAVGPRGDVLVAVGGARRRARALQAGRRAPLPPRGDRALATRRSAPTCTRRWPRSGRGYLAWSAQRRSEGGDERARCSSRPPRAGPAGASRARSCSSGSAASRLSARSTSRSTRAGTP